MQPRVKRALWLGLGCGLVGVLASLVPSVLRLEETAGLAWLFALRGPIAAPPEVAVVSIDAESANALGLQPKTDQWPRHLHGELVDRLAAAGAAVVAFDIMFDTPRAAAEDQPFAAAVAGAGNVILLERLRSETVPSSAGPIVLDTRVPPLPLLKEASLASAPFPLPVVPIRVGQFWTFGRSASDVPTLPSVALAAYLERDEAALLGLLDVARPGLSATVEAASEGSGGLERRVRALRLAFEEDPALAPDLRAALDRGLDADRRRGLEALIALYAGPSSHYLNYYGPQRSFLTLPYHRVLDDPEAAAELAGKVVFVGFSETRQPEQQDAFYSVFSENTGLNLPGVEIGATAFANLLEQSTVEVLPRSFESLLLLGWGLVLGLVLLVPSSAWGLAGVAALLPLYVGVAAQQFAARSLWLPLIVPLLAQAPVAVLAAVGWNYARARSQIERIRGALGYYLPPQLVERLARETVESSSELLHGTCLVTDAEQYTALSETLSPEALRELLNAYYRVLVGDVQRRHGFVSDIVGDSMVAVWASGEPRRSLRRDACETALAILADVEAFNGAQGHRGLPTRVGLHCGEVLLGNVGAESHFSYRAIGDIVNTASRIQALNKRLGTRLLASAAALDGLEGFAVRAVGAFRLAGKREPLEVFEIVAAGALGPERAAFAAAFAEGLGSFRAGQWTAAREAFAAAQAHVPVDGPTRFYLELSERRASERSPAEAGAYVSLAEK